MSSLGFFHRLGPFFSLRGPVGRRRRNVVDSSLPGRPGTTRGPPLFLPPPLGLRQSQGAGLANPPPSFFRLRAAPEGQPVLYLSFSPTPGHQKTLTEAIGRGTRSPSFFFFSNIASEDIVVFRFSLLFLSVLSPVGGLRRVSS